MKKVVALALLALALVFVMVPAASRKAEAASRPNVVILLSAESVQPLRFERHPGSRTPLHASAIGKALLAFGDSDPESAVAALTEVTRRQTFAAGQGLPGRVWAFRRPIWGAEVSGPALRAGLVSSAAFPITHGD